MGWEAHATSIADPVLKEKGSSAAIGLLSATADQCRKAGHDMQIVSCGGTGNLSYCVKQPGVTEVQVGGAVLSDEHYRGHHNVNMPVSLTLMRR
jgi:D-serine deaminase-like pyridoxal phosphate-dependent protein